MTDEQLKPILGKRVIIRVLAGASRIGRIFRNPDGTYRVVAASQGKMIVSAQDVVSAVQADK